MRRGAIATGVSLAGHAIALLYLLHQARPARLGATIGIAISDVPPSAHAAPPSSTPAQHEPADRRPIPRARHRSVVRVDPSPAPAPTLEPAPVAPVAEAGAGDDGPPGDGSGPGSATVTAGPAATPSPSRGEARPPGLDRTSCIENVDYPWRAKLLDKEGMVRLRVVLGSDGRVQSATVIQRAGYGFDETAVAAVQTRCRFTPAYDEYGRAVPYVIENYHFYFRLDDFDPQAAMHRMQQRWGR
jgi:TonB family protein